MKGRTNELHNGDRHSLDRHVSSEAVSPADGGVGISRVHDAHGGLCSPGDQHDSGLPAETIAESADRARPGGAEPNPAILQRIPRDACTPPAISTLAGKLCPNLQECLRATVTSKGKPRAGGDLKIVAAGQFYRVVLTMPEEGKTISCLVADFLDCFKAMEAAITDPAPAWVPASSFALKRRQMKRPQEDKDGLTTRPDPW
jgi:hypothetical protein